MIVRHDKKMQYFSLILVFLLIFLYVGGTASVDNEDELLWSNGMGNARNTRRLVPSLSTDYNGKNWNYVFNSSSQDTTVFGTGVGINGDLYTFLSESQYSSGSVL